MKQIPDFRTAYNYDTDAASHEASLLCDDQSLTQQQFKEETDINTIVARFGIGYEMPEDLPYVQNADFDEIFDFQSAMNLIIEAERSFAALDADTRARFNNDPARFVSFCSDPQNQDEMIKMGLAVRRPDPVVPEPIKVEVVSTSGTPPT